VRLGCGCRTRWGFWQPCAIHGAPSAKLTGLHDALPVPGGCWPRLVEIVVLMLAYGALGAAGGLAIGAAVGESDLGVSLALGWALCMGLLGARAVWRIR
jgi:hypothetical protein